MAIEKVRRLGVYAPLSATYYEDDDIADAGEAAELLYVRGLAFSARRPADGFISDTQVVRFVGVGMSDALDRAEALVKVGLWERVDGGFVVRSWLKWNKSAEELGQDLSRDRDRKRKQSEARADAVLRDIHEPTEGAGNPAEPDTGSGEDSEQDDQMGLNGIREVSARNPQESLPNTMHLNSIHDTSLTHLPDEPASQLDQTDEEIAEVFALGDAFIAASAPPPRKRHSTTVAEEQLFADFWGAYPRNVDKGHARKAFFAALKRNVDPFVIINGARGYRDDPKRPREPKFIPYPSTWINGERWTDSPNVTPPPKSDGQWWDN